jgi:hypothetical protein
MYTPPPQTDRDHSGEAVPSLLDYRDAYVSAISLTFWEDEAPVTRPVVLRQARDSESAVHDRGCAGHWFACLVFEVLVVLFCDGAEIIFEESPFGSIPLLRVLEEVPPARLERFLVLLPSFFVCARLSWLPLRTGLGKNVLMGKREQQRRGHQQQHRPKPGASPRLGDANNAGIHFETHPHPSKA